MSEVLVPAGAFVLFIVVAYNISEREWGRLAGIAVASAVVAALFWQPILDVVTQDRVISEAGYSCGKTADVDLGKDDQCTEVRQAALAVMDDWQADFASDCRAAHAEVGTLLFSQQYAEKRVGRCRVSGAVDTCEPEASVCTLPISEGRIVEVAFRRAW